MKGHLRLKAVRRRSLFIASGQNSNAYSEFTTASSFCIIKDNSLASLDEMKGAILEVLLVSAKGIDRAHILGHPGYHVIVECGTQISRSKTSSGSHEKIYWNEKLVFELPESELEALSHLKLRIVKEEHFSDGEFVGETIIFLKGIIVEGNYSGLTEIHPAPFNVVLEDDTYNGQMNVGLKWIPNSVVHTEGTQCVPKGNVLGESICTVITSIWKLKWWRLFSSYRNRYLINKHKEN